MDSKNLCRFSFKSRRGTSILAFCSFLFGVKLSLIRFFGNATPYWDQWDYEADYLYRPFLEGSLHFFDLFANLNEHRVLMTRLLNLCELKLNSTWNPLFQMAVNSGLHIAAIIFIVRLLAETIGRKHFYKLLTFSAILFALPYAWENTLAGIQSMFYFVLFFSVASIWFLSTSAPFSKKWFVGAFLSIAAFFSLSSGAFAPAAVIVVAIMISIRGVRYDWKHWASILALTMLVVLCVKYTPIIPGHASLKASSFTDLMEAIRQTLSWPEGASYIAIIVRNLPVILFSWVALKEGPAPNHPKWFMLTLIVWMTGTSVALAYARSSGSTAPRYLDLLAIFLLLNFACCLSIADSKAIKYGKKYYRYAGLWAVAVAVSFFINAGPKIRYQLESKRDTGRIQEANTRAYLVTHDQSLLRNAKFLEIPYPDAERLIAVLDSQTVRKILPSNLRSATDTEKTGRLDWIVNGLIKYYYLFLIFGIFLGLYSFRLRVSNDAA